MSSSKVQAISASSFLPSEIIEAIFYLLPEKSLRRFKPVSKTWNSLISDHLQNTSKLILVSNTTSLLYSLDTNQLLPFLNTNNTRNNDNDDDDDIHATVKELSFRCNKVLGSCNGLILAKDEKDSIFLINPTTQERCEVPVSPFVPPGGDFVVNDYGFGYDSYTDDYKIATISVWFNEGELGYDPVDTYLTVYSLRNNSWKKLPDSSHFVGLYVVSPVVVNHQSFNWIHEFPTIAAFSFTTEEFKEFEFQYRDSNDGRCVQMHNMVDIGGKIGVCFSKQRVYELWVMKDYGNHSWTRVCFHEFKDLVKPVCLVEGSNRDIILDVEGGDHVLVFNIDEERCRNVKIDGSFGGFNVLGTYVESLESPKRILTAH